MEPAQPVSDNRLNAHSSIFNNSDRHAGAASISLDKKAVRSSLKRGDPIILRQRCLTPEHKHAIISILGIILDELKREFHFGILSYVVAEMLDNAQKALLKRAHFHRLGLDIDNPESYNAGMKSFLAACKTEQETLIRIFKQLDFFITATYQVVGRELVISVRNSGIPTEGELQRIRGRISTAQSSRQTALIFTRHQDRTEGFGMGTITLLLLMRSIGIPSDAFRFETDPGKRESLAQVRVPLDIIEEEHEKAISEIIVKEINSIPNLPENILELRALLGDQLEVDLSEVVTLVKKDPVFCAELLRIANSALYSCARRISHPRQAAALIGLKGLRNIALGFGVWRAMNGRTRQEDFREIWKHSQLSAFFAYQIAMETGMPALADDAYIGALLHDIGRIVVEAVHPGLMKMIDAYCLEKGISGNALEKLSMGGTHAMIGAAVAEKWHFPQSIICPIAYHHQPLIAPDGWKGIVAIVHIADQMAKQYENPEWPAFIESDVLHWFGGKTEQEIAAIIERIAADYGEQ
jgi:putative nucleotidyltransferase with HDIG domain